MGEEFDNVLQKTNSITYYKHTWNMHVVWTDETTIPIDSPSSKRSNLVQSNHILFIYTLTRMQF